MSGVADNLRPNEKSYIQDENRSPSGNAINAARILTRLRVPTLTTGFLGGSTGEEIKNLLDEEDVKNNFIKIKGHSRICVTVSNKKDHLETRLDFPGPYITNQEFEKLFKLLKSQKNISILLIGGSLPQGLNPTDVIKLMNFARKQKIECVVDCPGNILRILIAGKPILIKPNLNEFQEMTESSAKSIRNVQKEARKLLNRVSYICVSSVEGGALLITKNNSYFGQIPKVKIRSSVGAGDYMVGAMVSQLYKKTLVAIIS